MLDRQPVGERRGRFVPARHGATSQTPVDVPT
jgi:hypothetical protein